MTRLSPLNPVTAGPSQSATSALSQLDLDSFLRLMIVELQNQDPLNPLDNKDMLAQISQLRGIAATDQLTQTLEAVLLGQNIASATNLIGAEITALSDDNQRISGLVERVSIENGQPKVHVILPARAAPAGESGNIDAGTYSYRVVWEDEQGKLFGIELSGANAITTTGQTDFDRAIRLSDLPVTKGIKQVYRTDGSGDGMYRLVGVITNGAQNSFVDRLSDEERFGPQQTEPFQRSTNTLRRYTASLRNISEIRPPS